MKKYLIVLLALVVLAACGGDESSDMANPAYGPITVEGDGLAPFQTAANDPAVGQPAPSISGVNQNGEEVTFTPGQGPSVLVFLAHWCPHCQQELPTLVDWVAQNPDTLGVDMYAVATGTTRTQGNYPPGPWIEREGWDQSVIMDDENSTAGVRYGLTSYPFWVIVDSDGNVAARAAGELPAAEIDRLMNEVSGL